MLFLKSSFSMIVESERHLHESHRTLRDALFCGVSVPGTSCLASYDRIVPPGHFATGFS
jgi:hypothetical protein